MEYQIRISIIFMNLAAKSTISWWPERLLFPKKEWAHHNNTATPRTQKEPHKFQSSFFFPSLFLFLFSPKTLKKEIKLRESKILAAAKKFPPSRPRLLRVSSICAPDFPSDLPSFSPSLLTRDLPIWFERSHPFLSVFFLIYLSPERPSLRSPRRRAVAAVVSFADWILCLISCGEVSDSVLSWFGFWDRWSVWVLVLGVTGSCLCGFAGFLDRKGGMLVSIC